MAENNCNDMQRETNSNKGCSRILIQRIDQTDEFEATNIKSIEQVQRHHSKKQSIAKKWSGGRMGYIAKSQYVDVDLGTRHIGLKLPIPGAVYTKDQCIDIITETTVKGSRERGKLIRFMAQYEFVPSKRGLYNLLQRYNCATNKELFLRGLWLDDKDNNWGMTIRENLEQLKQPLKWKMYEDHDFEHLFSYVDLPSPKKIETIGERGENTAYSIEGFEGWKGRLLLHLIPYHLTDWKWNRNAPTQYNHGTLIDICEYIGHVDTDYLEKYEDKLRGLYFSTYTFPPPTDIENGGSSDSFLKLKSYIELASAKQGSPVICSNGNAKKHLKVFICKRNKVGSGSDKICPFSFQIGWDKYGYFIHLRSSTKRSRACGCSWHCVPCRP